MAAEADDSRAVFSLVLGLLGLMMCQLFGPLAWYLGAAVRREDREEGRPPNTLATVGMVLGIVDTVLFVVQLLFFAVFCVIYGGFFALWTVMVVALGLSGA
jgi:hypothetical protein